MTRRRVEQGGRLRGRVEFRRWKSRRDTAAWVAGCADSRDRMVSGMHRYLMEVWNRLPADQIRALGFSTTDERVRGEEGLSFLAYMLMDCANLMAVSATELRQKRLLGELV